MSLQSFVSAVLKFPSITTWTRLEPLPREGSMARSLQAQVRDPLWFLTRQWQVGEFLASDAGSPVQATLGLEQRSITTYRPGLDDSSTGNSRPQAPYRSARGTRSRHPELARFGATRTLLRKVTAGFRCGFPAGRNRCLSYRRFPSQPKLPASTSTDSDSLRFRSLAAGRVTDGESLFVSALAVANGQTPPIPLPPQASDPKVATALSAFVTYRQSLFSEPDHDPAWQSQKLDYAFALGSPAPEQNLLLNAPEFPGGHLDWYSFDLDNAQTNDVAQANPGANNSCRFQLSSQPCGLSRHARSALVELRRRSHGLRPTGCRPCRPGQAAGHGVCAGLRQRLVLDSGADSNRDSGASDDAGGHRHLRRAHRDSTVRADAGQSRRNAVVDVQALR